LISLPLKLENKLQSELSETPFVDGGRDCAECGVALRRARKSVLRMVKQIEKFRPELCIEAFRNAEIL
jgi:hypothetical protein